jgi:hypothetical protein
MTQALRRAMVLVLMTAAVTLTTGIASASAHSYDYWFAQAQQKVYLNTATPSLHGTVSWSAGGSTLGPMTLSAARSEYEGRQLVIRPWAGAVMDIWLQSTDLTAHDASGNASVITSDNVSFFKVQYVNVTTPSSGYTKKGYQPDALLPMTLANGERLGWRYQDTPDWQPRTVRSNVTQPFYVLFYAPEGAAPGTYEGTVTVSCFGDDGWPMPALNVPVRLTVYPFSIAQRTLRTSFSFSVALAKYFGTAGHGWLAADPTAGKGSWRIPERTTFHGDQLGGWFKYMSEHRIAPRTLVTAWESGSDWAPPDDDGMMKARQEYLQDYLDTGTATTFTGRRLAFDSVPMPEYEARPSYVTDPFVSTSTAVAASVYYGTMQTQLLPWLSKTYAYVVDEPTGAKRKFVERYADFVHRYAPGVKFLVTVNPTDFGYKPLRAVDIYVEKLHFFYRDYYRWIVPLRKSGKGVWIYSHMTPHQWAAPMYLIDKPLTDSRVQGWFAYQTGADGLLYFNLDRWVAPTRSMSGYRDPYKDPLSLAGGSGADRVTGNGEGSLVYPGYYPALGLNVQGSPPVGSLRMEALRDGLEDYEYLKLLEQRRGRTYTLKYVKRIIDAPSSVYQSGRVTFPVFPKTPDPYQTTRDAVAGELSR